MWGSLTPQVRSWGHAPGQLRFRPISEQQQGSANAPVAQGDGFFEGAQGQGAGSRCQGHPGHRQGAMAVGFVFHYREQPQLRWFVPEDALEIALEPAEVDFNPSGAREGQGAEFRAPREGTSRRAVGAQRFRGTMLAVQ